MKYKWEEKKKKLPYNHVEHFPFCVNVSDVEFWQQYSVRFYKALAPEKKKKKRSQPDTIKPSKNGKRPVSDELSCPQMTESHN